MQQQGAAHKRLLLDDEDPKMAAFDDVEVQVGSLCCSNVQAHLLPVWQCGPLTTICCAVTGPSAAHMCLRQFCSGFVTYCAVLGNQRFFLQNYSSSALQAGCC